MDVNALLDKSFDELTPAEWEALKALGGDEVSDEEIDRAAELKTRLATSVDSDRFYRVVAEILNS